MPRALPLLSAAVATVAIACGETTTGTPSPEAIATAEFVARSVTIEAPASTTPESDNEPLVQLDGRIFGDGPRAVILAHMRPSDQTSWFPFATTLAEDGSYTAVTFDFRGFGDSSGDKQFDRIDTDLTAVYAYVRDTLDKDEIFIIGASMGGTAALVVSARNGVEGVVSISSPAQFPPLDAIEYVGDIAAPKLLISSEDDVPAMRSQEELWDAARAPKDEHVYTGDAHGTNIFDSEHAGDLERRLIDFLEAN